MLSHDFSSKTFLIVLVHTYNCRKKSTNSDGGLLLFKKSQRSERKGIDILEKSLKSC